MALPIPVAYAHLLGNYEFHTSNYVMLLYDHMLTFGDEVEKMWSRPFTFPSLLYYLNRYITHFQYIVIQVGAAAMSDSPGRRRPHSSQLPSASCLHLLFFILTLNQGLVIMILRVYALYLGNKVILVFLLSLLVGQIIVSAWAVHLGRRVPQPASFPGCVLTGQNSFFAALWGAPLVTDSCIFALTLWRTIRYTHKYGRMRAMEIILRDGTMFYFAIFGVNLMNTLIYFLALGDLKAVGARLAAFHSYGSDFDVDHDLALQLNLRYADDPSLSNAAVKPIQMEFKAPRQALSTVAFQGARSHTDSTFFSLGNLGGFEGYFFPGPDLGRKY
ncbi:hypothetical protein BD779DRAFT_1669659 [Infundibulicybe gibba]|nr:hypothetical protein BD779DRAFT_1669659 [Infundibulicybe gibba]